jgi:hypothetical protein
MENLIYFINPFNFCVFFLFVIIFYFFSKSYRKERELLEEEKKELQKTIYLQNFLLSSDDSNKKLVNIIKKNEIEELAINAEYFIDYYNAKIKKWNFEQVGQHLIFIESELLGFYKYQEVANQLQYFLKCAIIKNVSFSAKIVAEGIINDSEYSKKCELFILTTFKEKNKEVFPDNNNGKNVSSFLSMFITKLREFCSSMYENPRNLEIEKKFVDFMHSLDAQ